MEKTAMSEMDQLTATAPSLTITCANRSYEILAEDGPITIGRQFPAQVQIDDARISRMHLRLEVHDGAWQATDHSTNGTFVDGVRRDRITITDGLTVHLGNPEGIPVSFAFTAAPADGGATAADPASGTGAQRTAARPDPADVTTAVDGTDPGYLRAGAAVAARRRDLDISQRSLAADGVVNAGALIAFEKGRSWPRKSTREKLERVLQWPPGTIDRIRRGQPVPGIDEPDTSAERTEAVTTNIVQAPLMAQAVEIALSGLEGQVEVIGSLPEDQQRTVIQDMLTELRRLEGIASNAARTATQAPDVAMALSRVRRTYRTLMLRAARAPWASRGQKLFEARYRAELTADEAANIVGVDANTVVAAEADEPLTPEAESAIISLLDWLKQR